MSKLVWNVKTTQHSNGFVGSVSTVAMFSVDWDGVTGNNHPEGPWRLTTKLPNLNPKKTRFATTEDAEHYASLLLTHWMGKVGMVFKEGA